MIQMDRDRPLEALKSFGQYARLGGAMADADVEAKQLAASLRSSIPRGAFNVEMCLTTNSVALPR